MFNLNAATVAINIYLLGGQSVRWFTLETIAARLAGHSKEEVQTLLENMINDGYLLRARKPDGTAVYSLAVDPLYACTHVSA